ncbi:hypothetical protein ACFLYF_04575 [Chloroflexota bacterium]
MPYKRKEDRTEAVRRHREKKKAEEGLIHITSAETLGQFLKDDLGFDRFKLRDFIEWCQEGLIVSEQGIKNKETGLWLDSTNFIYMRLDTSISIILPEGT